MVAERFQEGPRISREMMGTPLWNLRMNRLFSLDSGDRDL